MDHFFDHYHPGQKDLWTGRTDGKTDKRWHQVIQAVDLKAKALEDVNGHFVLLGFASDEGVRRNRGRVGAAAGPDHLRKALSSLSWNWGDEFKLFDAGDVVCSGQDLEEAQAGISIGLKLIYEKGGFPFVLGGGHETAWGSFMGIRQSFDNKHTVGVINIDAHFDLRTSNDGPNSGTPFRQMAEYCDQKGRPFNYCCLGINPAANTRSLFQTASDYEVTYLTIDELFYLPMERCLEKLELFMDQVDLIYLTIDLDAFDGAFAPGVSAPAATGLSPSIVIPFLNAIVHSNKLALLDVCELNPNYDQDNRTAKLGANLIFRVMDLIMKVK